MGTDPATVSLRSFVEEVFLPECLPTRTKRQASQARGLVRLLSDYLGHEATLGDLRPEPVRAFLAVYATRHRPSTVADQRARLRRIWRHAHQRHPDIEPPPGRPAGPTDATRRILHEAARLRAAGYGHEEAAGALDIKPNTLSHHQRKHAALYAEMLGTARQEHRPAETLVVDKPTPHAKQDFPTDATRAAIRKATALKAAGWSDKDVCRELGVKRETLRHWRKRYGAIYQADYDRAMETALVVVQRQAGTSAILDDPEAFLRQALAVERWAAEKDRPIFPPPDEITLSTFYRSRYLPVRLGDAQPRTIDAYEQTIRYWVLLIGDPPLADITTETLCLFRDLVGRALGRPPVHPLSPNTIRKHLRVIQAVLDHAGPPVRGNRDAAGILDKTPPWIRPPRPTFRPVRVVSFDQLNHVYLAAVAMDAPRLYGLKPPAWWRALIVTAYNTGLRKGNLFNLRMDQVDWPNRRLHLPPEGAKTRRGQDVHLNQTTMAHLLAIRTDREYVFAWPQAIRQFDRLFHRLQDFAGIPRPEHFGLHAIRKTTGTALWRHSPQAAQLELGHTTLKTTIDHYIQGDDILRAALDGLPQPEAFGAEAG